MRAADNALSIFLDDVAIDEKAKSDLKAKIVLEDTYAFCKLCLRDSLTTKGRVDSSDCIERKKCTKHCDFNEQHQMCICCRTSRVRCKNKCNTDIYAGSFYCFFSGKSRASCLCQTCTNRKNERKQEQARFDHFFSVRLAKSSCFNRRDKGSGSTTPGESCREQPRLRLRAARTPRATASPASDPSTRTLSRPGPLSSGSGGQPQAKRRQTSTIPTRPAPRRPPNRPRSPPPCASPPGGQLPDGRGLHSARTGRARARAWSRWTRRTAYLGTPSSRAPTPTSRRRRAARGGRNSVPTARSKTRKRWPPALPRMSLALVKGPQSASHPRLTHRTHRRSLARCVSAACTAGGLRCTVAAPPL